MANATSTELQELYVAYFGRAADPTGLDYWTEKGITTAKFAADMYVQAEFKDAYGSLTTEAQVNQIYKNLFDREADVTGLTYWTQQVNLGTLKLAEIATHLIWAAKNNTGSADDKTALSNRTNAAVAYTAKVKETTAGILAYAAESTDPFTAGDNIAEAKSYLSGIDKDTAHTAAGIAASVTTINNNGVQSTKLSFIGTTGVDTFTGSTGSDTFTFDNTVSDKSSTADTLVGGAGTDTLKIYSEGSADPLPALTGVEAIEFYDLDSTLVLNGSAQSSLTTATLTRGDGALSFTIGAGLDTVNLVDMSLTGVGTDAGIVIYHNSSDTAAVVGLDDVLVGGASGITDENIDLNGAGLTSATFNVTNTSTADVIDVAGAATITINATGNLTASSLTTSSTTAALTITGAGNVSLGTIDNGIDSLTASSSTGVTTFTAPADNSAFVATLGSGADVVTTNDDGFATANAFNIDAGAGTDVLVAGAAADLNTAAEGARYDNFETLRTGVSQDLSLISGITGVQLTAASATTISGMNATNMASVEFRADNATSTTFTPTDATGSSDSITITAKSTTATTTVDLIGISVDNIETVNFVSETGSASATGATTNAFGFLANKADEVTAINITGDADVLFTNVTASLDVVAVTIDASGMTGVGDLELVQTANLVTGSTVIGSSNGDTIGLGTTLGSTYNLGAGNDGANTVIATLVSDGTDDTVLNMGAGTDTLTISDTAATTITDSHFTNVSAAEKLILSSEGALSLTTGASFTSAFASGVTITSSGAATDDNFTYAGGNYDQATTINYTTSVVGDSTIDGQEDITITTGDAADTVTVTASSFVGTAAGDGGAMYITTDGGDDTISVTTGTILAQTISEVLTIDAGAGADTITLVTNTANSPTSAANIIVQQGDSLSTAYDTITGFDLAGATTDSMELQFDGSAAVSDFSRSNDYGVIMSHTISTGVATFDDVGSHTTALVINSGNLADVVGYLNLNTDDLDTVGFLFDSTGNGSNDAVMCYNNGVTTDSLVLLKGNSALTGLTITNTDDVLNQLTVT